MASISQQSRGRVTFIDLFSGCGGFTLGFLRAGARCLAAVDNDPHAVATLRSNLIHRAPPGLPTVENAVEADLTRLQPEELARLMGTDHVDVVIGGPPCQGFSTARQRDGANHGRDRFLPFDPRRHLYQHFLRFVSRFRPKIFVMENVPGIRSAAGGEYLTRVQAEARELGYRVHGHIEEATRLGVPQKRRRQLFIGVRMDIPHYFDPALRPAPRAVPVPGSEESASTFTLWDAIGDLPPLRQGEGCHETDYDIARRLEHIARRGARARHYLHEIVEIERASKLTNHVARPHNERDLRDFAKLREGESSAVAMRRGVVFEFPYDKTVFKDRYTRQHREQPCSTIVAHLGKDGLMFIHPTQNRSLTPREAARVQSFPDWFVFPRARTHAFRLIGNAVPPLVAEAVALSVLDFLTRATERRHRTVKAPRSPEAAACELRRIAGLDRRQLRRLPKEDLLRGWYALLAVCPELHPDNARDHGHEVMDAPPRDMQPPSLRDLLKQRYVRTAWPVQLTALGEEVWRRVAAGEVAREEIYRSRLETTEGEPGTKTIDRFP